ncbi:NmrA family transcriptional regulator [[Actinomadura] parvosata subsp. kistnae]|uniref:NmrA family transcriptional regulator n=1 Tax=[Actinomadura] parvosata subsp. kistnae TaxID=1909395 RepID=A0A1V0AJP8_9ACTN|nr:NmrA family transcriptional regulator [Nonomuraea sp. ATCC 55076]
MVRGDFDDPASLPPALDGVAAVFGVPPVAYGPSGPETGLEAARGRALIDAAVKAGVEQVVFSTVASLSTSLSTSTSASTSASSSAPARGGRGKRLIEEYLHDHVALPTVLRPVRFMTNYLGVGAVAIDGLSPDGVHRHLFPPHEPMQVIALEDIAEFAALAFADPARFAGRTLELAGDEPTPVEAAAAITAATGLPIRYEQITGDDAARLGPEVADTMRHWHAGHRWHADLEALRVIHPGLRTLSDWLAESGASAIRAHLAGI